VPVNFANLRDKKWGELKVALAGPVANLGVALVCGLLIRFLALPENLVLILSLAVMYNILLALFNLVPVPPLDGSHILFSFVKDYEFKANLYRFGFFILIAILFFTPLLDFLYYLTMILANFITGGVIL
jgi:Zn-dependent protease